MELFQTNQNKAERVLRFILAVLLIPSPLVLGSNLYSLILCMVGLILLFNALIGTCMIYKIFGVNTCKN
ncbi:MAG: hypothetical protein CMG04_09645 [Candidatus Marinimicrobia bacterium]|nr:hypothetical protein [Candidatus Neomarinimicrobiota bacterium]